MRRLKNLDVHEISLVKAGANRKKYLVLKTDTGASMTDHEGQAPRTLGDKLAEAFGKIPRQKLEDAEVAIAKARSAVKKADDGETGGLPADDDTQEALRAAFKLLAAHADQLNADTMADFVSALGIEADDVADADQDADDEAMADGAEEVAQAKDATMGPELTDQDTAQKADGDSDEDEDKAQKADGSDEGDDKDEEAQKADDAPASAPDGMPDFADASSDDIDAAMGAARKAYADAMLQKGKKQAAAAEEGADGSTDDKMHDASPFKKSSVAKSSVLKGLSKEQQAFLEPIFKAHEDRVASLERAHKEMVEKSAKSERQLRHKQFVEKAARQYAHLGPAEEVGAGLLRVSEKDPDGLAAWEAVLKSANQRAAEGGERHLFSELGSGMAMPSGMTAEDELRQAIDGIVQKSNVSREKAEAEFYQTPQGRSIYSKIQRQKRN